MGKIFAVTLLSVLVVGCSQPPHTATPTPLPVVCAEAVVDTVPLRREFIGYLASNFDAVIQPRINGFLLRKHFDSGMPVRRGALLFEIDPSQFRNAVLAAEAAVQSARAQAIEARNNYHRAVPLAAMNAISQAELEQYTAQHKAAEASVQSAEQQLRNTRLDLSYTRILSPIDGIVSNSAAYEGDYVGPTTQFSVLTTISNLDTMSVDLALPMAEYLRVAGVRSSIYDNEGLLSEIWLRLPDGTRYPFEGFYKYTRKDVSAATGTLVIVVGFPNPDGGLKAGQFARIEATLGVPRPQVVVPVEAVSQAQGINSVWVVRRDSTVAFRKVSLGAVDGQRWCIAEGLSPEEWVVVEGGQKLREGVRVAPQTKRN